MKLWDRIGPDIRNEYAPRQIRVVVGVAVVDGIARGHVHLSIVEPGASLFATVGGGQTSELKIATVDFRVSACKAALVGRGHIEEGTRYALHAFNKCVGYAVPGYDQKAGRLTRGVDLLR